MEEEIEPEESNLKEMPVKINPVENHTKKSLLQIQLKSNPEESNAKEARLKDNPDESNKKVVNVKKNPQKSNTEEVNAKDNAEKNSKKKAAVKNTPDQSNTVAVDISIADELSDITKTIKDSGIANFDDSISIDNALWSRISRLEDLLGRKNSEKQIVAEQTQHSAEKDSQIREKLNRQSKYYKKAYYELTKHFRKWKPCRERLVGILKSSPNTLQRISNFVSGFRIFTSAADILGTLARSLGSQNWYANFAMENASLCSLVVVFLEQIYFQKIQLDIKAISKEDGEFFKELNKCFDQIKKLDEDFISFFPSGIDTDIVKKLNESPCNFNYATKLFLAIVFSNVKEDETLGEEFIQNAREVSTSEAGKEWLQKIIFADDACAQHCVNAKLCGKIQELVEMSKQDLTSPNQDLEACSEVGFRLSWEAKMKMVVNGVTILLALKSILCEEGPGVSKDFERLAKEGEKQLEDIKKLIVSFKPPDIEIDADFK